MIRRTESLGRYRFGATTTLVAALVAAGWLSAPASGQIVDWTNAGGGLFADGGNWLGGAAPGMTESARFALPDTYMVDLDGVDVNNVDLLADDGSVTLMSSTGVPTYTLSGTVTVTGELTISSLELDIAGLLVDGGQMTFDAASALTVAPLAPITLQNAGVLNMAIDFNVVGSTVTIDGTGSLLNVSGADVNLTNGSLLLLSDSASVSAEGFHAPAAVIEVTTGGQVTANDTLLGDGGSTGSLRLFSGATADLGVTDIAVSNNAGTGGTLRVDSGATATADSVRIATGGLSAQNGELRVGGNFTQNGAASITVGAASQQASQAKLRIDAGGTVTTGTGGLSVFKTGTVTNAGMLNVSGDFLIDGGTYQVTDAAAEVDLAAGSVWTVQNGGRLLLNPDTTISLGADRALEFAGGTTLAPNLKNVELGTTVGGTSRLTLTNDATLALDSVTLSESVDGSDARLEVLGGATLTVTDQVGVASTGLASTATVEVSGADSALNYQAAMPLAVGSATGGAAELRINDGGSVDLGGQGLYVG
ncbi:MAG: hypothetical protein KDA63_20370, partial [Planctomycetales bacterium]|nr:hypothetical protein [Planctomycetales bacterium]